MNLWNRNLIEIKAGGLATICLGVILTAGANPAALAQQNGTQNTQQNDDHAALDAQTESDVIIALDSAAALKDQQIAASTVNGDVTLTGMVNDPASKQLAGSVAGRVKGVRSIENDLTVASRSTANQGQAQEGNQAQDGQVLQAEVQQPGAPGQPGSPDQPGEPGQMQPDQAPMGPGQNQGQMNQAAPPNQAQNAAPYPYPSGPAPRPEDDMAPDAPQPNDQQSNGGYPSQQRPEYQGAPGNPNGIGGPNQGPANQGSQGPYDQGNNRGYGHRRYDDRRYDDRQYSNQNSGPVTLPAATLLRVRTSEFLDARKLQPGAMFEATAAQDVYVGGVLAIPRGATLQGVVEGVKSSTSGSMTGSNSLSLKLTQLNLEGRTYPIATDVWAGHGPGKGGYSANNTIGGAAVGAVIGAIIGRGPGAAIGAVAGGATGAAASSATSGPRMVVPPESVLTFHLAQPVTVTPVSSQEAQRLASANQPSQPYLRQRYGYYPPPPPPYYYGPAYYGPYYGPRFVYGRVW